jgi:hypothetical protein
MKILDVGKRMYKNKLVGSLTSLFFSHNLDTPIINSIKRRDVAPKHIERPIEISFITVIMCAPPKVIE